MAISTYERVLDMTKHLELPEQLQLLEALSRIVRGRVEQTQERSILELEGLGAEIWQDVDAHVLVSHPPRLFQQLVVYDRTARLRPGGLVVGIRISQPSIPQ